MDISIKEIVCTTIDEGGNVVRKDTFENRFEKLDEFLRNFSEGDSFVMESTGFYEPLYDFIESRGFKVKLANPLKIKLIAESRMKNDDIKDVKVLQTIPGIGLFSALIIYSEIGDIQRFPSSSKLLSCEGTIPSVRQSSDVIQYGRGRIPEVLGI